jgi:toxin ParE1/3/4
MMIQRLAVVLSEKAIFDLEAIGAYILESSGSENIANGFVDRIKERCQSIGNAPRGGRPRDDIAPGLRMVPFEHSAVMSMSSPTILSTSSAFSMAAATTKL